MSRCFLLALCAMAVCTDAHESPDHVVSRLERQALIVAPSADALCRQGDELAALGRVVEAVESYTDALAIAEDHPAALIGMAKQSLALRRSRQALVAATRGAESSVRLRGAFLALQARAHEQLGDRTSARDAWAKAIAEPLVEVDSYLRYAALLEKLGDHQAAAEMLESAAADCGSVVLRRAWLGSLLHAEEPARALDWINDRYEDSDPPTSWRVLRAEARRQLGDRDGARTDLRAAVSSYRSRLPTDGSNPLLESRLAAAEAALDRLD